MSNSSINFAAVVALLQSVCACECAQAHTLLLQSVCACAHSTSPAAQ